VTPHADSDETVASPGGPAGRGTWLRRALWLSVATVAWNVLEGLIAILAGAAADSVALMGFGVDSFIETTSGAVVGWRFLLELRARRPGAAPRVERRAGVVAGVLLLVLALYIAVDAARRLSGLGAEPKRSVVGIVLAAVSLGVMPLLGWAKLRTARALASGALRADAYETVACVWLSLATLGGLLLNALLGWQWADPAAALLLIPLIVREGLEGVRGGD